MLGLHVRFCSKFQSTVRKPDGLLGQSIFSKRPAERTTFPSGISFNIFYFPPTTAQRGSLDDQRRICRQRLPSPLWLPSAWTFRGDGAASRKASSRPARALYLAKIGLALKRGPIGNALGGNLSWVLGDVFFIRRTVQLI